MSSNNKKEIEIIINDRPTIIKYSNDIDIKKFIEYYEEYKRKNRFRLKITAINYENSNFIIYDKEAQAHFLNKSKVFYADNQMYDYEKPFKTKNRFRLKIEKYLKRGKKKERKENNVTSNNDNTRNYFYNTYDNSKSY